MKGGTNLSAGDLAGVVKAEVERQERLHRGLEVMAEEFHAAGVPFEVMRTCAWQLEPYWDTGLVVGCNIASGSAYLCAFPPVPARTWCYMDLVQEPVAAQVVFASRNCVLMAPHGQDFRDVFLRVGEKYFGRRENRHGDFPGAAVAYRGNNFLCIESDE